MYKNTSKLIAKVRRKLGCSYTELGQLTGSHFQTFWNIEHGRCNCPPHVAKRLSKLSGIEVDEFIGAAIEDYKARMMPKYRSFK
jgi:ribosome-binding protein aMBF1 (putative translation factor)